MPYSVGFKLSVSPKAKKQGDYLAEKLGPAVREQIGQAYIHRALEVLESGNKNAPEEMAQFAEELIAKEFKRLKAAEADPNGALAIAARSERLTAKAAKAERVAAKAERLTAKAARAERDAKRASDKAP
jgi:hypothetical protein